MGYVRTFFVGGSSPVKPDPLPTFNEEVARFHETLEAVGALLASDQNCSLTTEQLLQGPFADAPVAPENFIYADIRAERLDADQPPPARPDPRWPESP
jgi:hypothetical protein